jgi:osmotically-inducible protein OsmY
MKEIPLILSKTLFALSLVVSVSGALGGCAALGKCDPGSCAGDAAITRDLRSQLNKMSEIGPPDSIHVQTVDSVVYLNGEVYSGLAKRSAEAVASREHGVTRVVNSIDVEHD